MSQSMIRASSETTIMGPDRTAELIASLQNLSDLEWLAGFLLTVGLTIALSTAIIYHPEINRKRETRSETELPKTMLTYSVIGMISGYLFIEVGEHIGFLIFGLGGLIRVRTDPGNSKDTGRVIVVTLIGLCVGLGLANIALLATIVVWIIIYFVERKNLYQLTVRFETLDTIGTSASIYRNAITRNGWAIVREKRSTTKLYVQYLIRTAAGTEKEHIENQISNAILLDCEGSVEVETV